MFTIGHRGVLRLGGWSPQIQTGFPVPRPTQGPLGDYPYGAVTLSGRTFQSVLVPSQAATGLVRVRSPLLAESRLMSFPPANEMVQFAGFASPPYLLRRRSRLRGGFPHSEIRGSQGARTSPRLLAACYVLHRLSVPRHPPDALQRLIQPSRDPHPRAQARAQKPRNRYAFPRASPRPSTDVPRPNRREGRNLFTMSNNESDQMSGIRCRMTSGP